MTSNTTESAALSDLQIYVFSYNRGEFLNNCLQSIKLCAGLCEVIVIDDRSNEETTKNILKKYKNDFTIIVTEDAENLEKKTGGLYNNMNIALSRAKLDCIKYVLFLQDDMQLVRPITNDDIVSANNFFNANLNVAELHTCFMKRYFTEIDEKYVTLDSSRLAYLRPLNYPGHSGFSAVGLFNVQRFFQLFNTLRKGEHANNNYAQSNNIQMGISTRPFMMWLPYPISYRGKKRDLPIRIVEKLGGCGLYPYQIMDEISINNLLSRDPSKLPYAEDWLKAKGLGDVKIWSFTGGLSNLYARGGIKNILGRTLSMINRHTKFY